MEILKVFVDMTFSDGIIDFRWLRLLAEGAGVQQTGL